MTDTERLEKLELEVTDIKRRLALREKIQNSVVPLVGAVAVISLFGLSVKDDHVNFSLDNLGSELPLLVVTFLLGGGASSILTKDKK